MKVILLTDVKPHGKKGDVVDVSDSLARNVLIKKNQAVEATPQNMNNLKLQNQHADKVAAENLASAKELKKQIEEWTVETSIKSGEGGRTFGSVSSKEIAQAVKDQYDTDIDKKKIIVSEPIKSLGTHEVKVKLHQEVTATLRVHVAEQS
ncbi:MAG: 50S ribosomal protein L9 [Lachnospiraceae bacterium]|nr:50S ribosomal protein L9 [Lachnospiraceae bacterium]